MIETPADKQTRQIAESKPHEIDIKAKALDFSGPQSKAERILRRLVARYKQDYSPTPEEAYKDLVKMLEEYSRETGWWHDEAYPLKFFQDDKGLYNIIAVCEKSILHGHHYDHLNLKVAAAPDLLKAMGRK